MGWQKFNLQTVFPCDNELFNSFFVCRATTPPPLGQHLPKIMGKANTSRITLSFYYSSIWSPVGVSSGTLVKLLVIGNERSWLICDSHCPFSRPIMMQSHYCLPIGTKHLTRMGHSCFQYTVKTRICLLFVFM